MWTSWTANWRSSYWFITAVVGLGILTDLLVYSIVISVMSFHLERLGYSSASSLTGWLLFAYSAGIVILTSPTNNVACCRIFTGQNRTGMGTPTCAVVGRTMVATHDHRQGTWHFYHLLCLRKYAIALDGC